MAGLAALGVAGATQAGAELSLKGLVCKGEEDGIAWVRTGEGDGSVVRAGGTVDGLDGGLPVRMTVTAVGPSGVAMTNAAMGAGSWLATQFGGGSGTSGDAGAAREGTLRHVEFNGARLGVALRMLSNQCGRNFAATPGAADTEVDYLGWDVTPAEVLSTLCRTYRLWAQADPSSGATSVRTLQEFQEDLEGYAPGEYSRVFALSHPQASEVASVIFGLYADRVELYLGDSDILEDDLNDLSRRIERYNMLSSSGAGVMNGFSAGNLREHSGSGGGGVYTRNADGDWEDVRRRESRVRSLDSAGAAAVAAAAERGEKETLDGAVAETRATAPKIHVTLSRGQNLLFVRTSDPRALEDIARLVERMDVPRPMVLLDVKVLEVSLGDTLDTVFDFQGGGKFHYDGPHEGGWTATLPAAAVRERGLTFNWLTEDFTGRIQLLKEKNRVKVLATPTLLTVNNEVSQLFMGKETPIVRNVSSQTVVTDNNVVTTPQTEIEFVRVGTVLLLTPNVNSNGTVTLRLLQENSGVAAEKARVPVVNASSGGVQYFDVDVVESRSVSGTFVAQDRQTIAIGGLVRETVSDVRSGIPVLMDIPLLGWLFRSTNKVKSRDELVVLLTPYVVHNPAEGGAASAEWAETRLSLDETRGAVAAPVPREKSPE